MSKKVVIIGSGMGGLSCAIVLAKNGYDVTVLEQGVQSGGCLQCFKAKGAKFETGMHFVGSADNTMKRHGPKAICTCIFAMKKDKNMQKRELSCHIWIMEA